MPNELDLTYLNEMLDDDALVKELIQTLKSDAPADMDLLKAALESGDVDTARVYSHKLKSSLAVFKIEPLRTSMERIEKMAVTGASVEELESERKSIATEFDQLINSLSNYL